MKLPPPTFSLIRQLTNEKWEIAEAIVKQYNLVKIILYKTPREEYWVSNYNGRLLRGYIKTE